MSDVIENTENYIDPSDVRARIDYLDGLAAEYDEALTDQDADPDQIEELLSELSWTEEEGNALRELWEQITAYGSDVQLINESALPEYAEQLAEDIGLTQSADTWPFSHIDWEAAADELASDMGTVDFDGVTYYVR